MLDLFLQTNRAMSLKSPLGENKLLPVACRGSEAISRLFAFEVDLLAPVGEAIPFEKVLGQSVLLEILLPEGSTKKINAFVNAFTERECDEHFQHLTANLVPKYWLWTQRINSRTFQHVNVPEILNQILDGVTVDWRLSAEYPKRDYVVQYQESDFAFASRLMEDEGIFYFFEHSDDKHTLVLADGLLHLEPIDDPKELIYEVLGGGTRDETRISDWNKTQNVISTKYTLWDHAFQLPDDHLDADTQLDDSLQSGTVTHKLQPQDESLEVYAYPGGYAGWFDDVAAGGGAQSADMSNVFDAAKVQATLRMEEQKAQAIQIRGKSNCVRLLPGRLFDLTRHPNADGSYLIREVEHNIKIDISYRSDTSIDFDPLRYDNTFVCLPKAAGYRPPRVTVKPRIHGVQTATVVGPEGEELFIDKYGRIKIQFHWDRLGANNADSSCWVRVGQVWAGRRWGAFFWPRIGHEVVVTFAEGDPDQPVIIGSVYNADNMPPLELPADREKGGIKSCIFKGDPMLNFNSIVFHDRPGHEYVQVHSENHELVNTESDRFHYVPQAEYTFHGGLF